MSDRIVQEAIAYFKSKHWNDLIANHLRNPDDTIYHTHIFLLSQIHPESIGRLFERYFKKIGHELDRKIDYIAPSHVALHTVHPQGLPHFDCFIDFSSDHVLAPLPNDDKGAEHGKNLLSWGKRDMDRYLSQFDFKCVGPEEEEKIHQYFRSRHWKEMIAYVTNPEKFVHAHVYVKINFDPKIIELISRQYMDRMGWIVDKVVPCLFDVNGEYRPKIVYLVGYPEIVFDIGWVYDENTVIEPHNEAWQTAGLLGYDLVYMKDYRNAIAAHDWKELSEQQIEQVAQGM
jgi:hypothetical protein